MSPQVFDIIIACIVAVVFLMVVRTVARLIENRHRSPAALPELGHLHERLARIEQIVETTALEVERSAEANRFVAKLLAERPVVAPLRVPSAERVITPH